MAVWLVHVRGGSSYEVMADRIRHGSGSDVEFWNEGNPAVLVGVAIASEGLLVTMKGASSGVTSAGA